MENRKGTSRIMDDRLRRTNMHLFKALEGQKRKSGGEEIFSELRVGYFPKLVKEIHLQTEDPHEIPNRINKFKSTPKHIYQ